MAVPAAPTPVNKPKRSLWKRLLWIGLGVLVMLTLVVLLLPTLLSFGPGRAFLLGRIESALGAAVNVDSLSLSWSGRAAVRDLEVTIPGDPVPVLKAAQATVATSIGDLIAGRYDVRLAIDQPEIQVVRAADGTFNFEKLGQRGSSEKPATPSAEGPSAKRPMPIDLKIDVVVTDGAVTIQDDALGKTSKWRGVQVSARNEKSNDPIRYSLKLRVSQSGDDGVLESSGTVDALTGGAFDVDKLRADIDVAMFNVDLGAWRSLAARYAHVEDCQGTIGAKLKATLAGRSKFETKGTLELEGLRLDAGKGRGAIREDHLALTTDLSLDLAADEVAVRTLTLRSTPATIDAKGTVHHFRLQPSGDFEGKIEIDLAKLVASAPAAFPADLRAAGTVQVSGTLGDDAGVPRLAVSARVRGLDVRGGPLEQPITEDNVDAAVVARVLREASKIGIDRASVTTSFANLTASGTLGGDGFRQIDVATELHADLAKACERAAGVLPRGLRAEGSIDSSLRIADDGHVASMAGATQVKGLRIAGGPLRAPIAQAAISLDLDVAADRAGDAFDAFHVRKGELVSSVVTVSAKGDVTALTSQPRADLSATIAGDLGRARAELGGFFTEDLELSGRLRTEVVATDDGKGATVVRLQGGLSDVVVRRATDSQPLREHEVSWAAQARYDRAADSLEVADGVIHTSFGDARIDATVASARSSGTARRIDARAALGIDLAKAAAALGAWLPQGLELAGSATGNVDAHVAGSTSQAKVHFETKDIAARGGGLTAPISEPRASLEFEGEYDTAADRLIVSKGELLFSGGKVVATGSASKIRSALEGEATVALSADLGAAAERLRGFMPAGQELRGSVSASFTARDVEGRTALTGSAEVRDLRASGGSLGAPVEEKESKLDVDLGYDRVKQVLDVSTLDLRASFAEAHAKGKIEGLSTRPRADFQGQLHVDLRSLSERGGAFLPDGLALAGAADARFQATSDASGTKFQATAATTDLSATGGPLKTPFAERRIDVEVRGAFADAEDRLVVESAKATTSFATLAASGKVERFSRSRDLTSELTLHANLEAAAERLAAFLPERTKLEGTTDASASVSGSLALGTVIALFGRADVKGGGATLGGAQSVHVVFDRAALRLENGVATLIDAIANVNGGAVKANGNMDLSKETRPFQATVVATDVALSGDLRSALQYAIPLFAQAPDAVAQASGLASMNLDVTGSLAAMPRTLAGAGSVRLSKGEITASPVVGGILADFGGPALLSFDSTSADFSIRNGRVESRNVKFNGKEATLALDGSVGFDQTLDYRVDARFVSGLLSKADRSRVGPYIDLLSGDDGVPIPIAVKGTLTRPSVKLELERLLQDPAAIAKRALESVGKKKDASGKAGGSDNPEDILQKGLEGLLGGRKRERENNRKSSRTGSPIDASWTRFVDATSGRVAYAALAADVDARRALAEFVAAIDPPNASPDERLAAALNRYDVAVMLGVAENLEAVRRAPRGVLDVPGFFDRKSRTIAGEDQTLDRYEARIRELRAPLYPFALMRASMGGPPPLPEPLHEGDVQVRLDTLARRYLDTSTEAAGGKLRVTELLFERAEAIVGASPQVNAAEWQRRVADLLDRLLPRKHSARNAGPLASLPIEPRGDWDWRLNEK